MKFISCFVPNPKLHCLLLEHWITIAWLIKHWFSFHNQFIRHHEYQCAIQHSIKHQPQIRFMYFFFFSFFYLFDAISCVMPISNLFYFQYISSLLAAVWVYIQLMLSIRHFNKSSNSASSTVLHFDILKRLSLFSSLLFLFPSGRSHFVIHWLCWLNNLYSAKVCKVDGKIFMSFVRV